MQAYKCSIDRIEDYENVKKIFKGLGKKSLKISFNDLIKRINKIKIITSKKIITNLFLVQLSLVKNMVL